MVLGPVIVEGGMIPVQEHLFPISPHDVDMALVQNFYTALVQHFYMDLVQTFYMALVQISQSRFRSWTA
jgi:hypothetical protein